MLCFVMFQKQTKEIKEKQTSVMAELAKVEPAVQDAKMGTFYSGSLFNSLPFTYTRFKTIKWLQIWVSSTDL